ncbi:DUF1648 domain-containing protein [bacterium]|nr:DUF1648 domain-containing protein [bacterium]
MNARASALVFLIVLAGVCLHLVWVAGQLPDIVASHFGAGGVADDHSSRTAFVALSGLIIFMVSAIFGGLALLMPGMPDAAINIPRKDYWLAPPRRTASLAYVGDWAFHFGAATLLFLAGTTHLTVLANRIEPARLSSLFWPWLLLYMAFVIVWVGRMLRAFPAPPPGAR